MADPYNLHLRLSWKKRLVRYRVSKIISHQSIKINLKIKILIEFPQNTIENATFPVPVKTLPLTVTIISAIHYADPNGSYDIIGKIPDFFT